MSTHIPKLAIASLKLESGATTTAQALAWTWGKLGLRVLLVTTGEHMPTELVSVSENVWLATGDDEADFAVGPQVVLVDCPPLSRLASHKVLIGCDGLALALPTTPHSQRSAMRCLSELSRMMRDDVPPLTSILPIAFELRNETHRIALASFHEKFEGLFVSAPVPVMSGIVDWNFLAGEDLPQDCQGVFLQIASELEALPPFRAQEKAPRVHEEIFRVISMDDLEPVEVVEGDAALAEESSLEGALDEATSSVEELVDTIDATPIVAPSAAMESEIDGVFAFGDGDFVPLGPSDGGSGSEGAAQQTVTVVVEPEVQTSDPAFAICVSGVGSASKSGAMTLAVAQSLSSSGQRVLVLNADPEVELSRYGDGTNEGEYWSNVLMGSGRKGEARERRADCVVLHAPQADTAAAQSVFAQVDGVLLVVPEGEEHLPALQNALASISDAQASGLDQRLLGVTVLGGAEDSSFVTAVRALLGDSVTVTPIVAEGGASSWLENGTGAPPSGEFLTSVESVGMGFAMTIASELVTLSVQPAEAGAVPSSEDAAGADHGTDLESTTAGSTATRTRREPGTPYVLAMASHKGGTGRTTATLGLAWALGRLGRKCVLYDMNPTPTLHLLAGAQPGTEVWPNVRLGRGQIDLDELLGADFVIVDAPPILETAGMEMVGQSHGAVLTTLPDPLAFRTIPGATAALEEAQTKNPDLEFLGLCVSVFDQNDPLQEEMIGDLRREVGDLCIEPPIPLQSELANWGLHPGTPLPAGPGRRAYFEFANYIEEGAGLERTKPSEEDLSEAPAPPQAKGRQRRTPQVGRRADDGRTNSSTPAPRTTAPTVEAPQFRGVAKRLTFKNKSVTCDEWGLFGSRGMTFFAQVVEDGTGFGLVPDQSFLDGQLTEKVAAGVARSGLLLSFTRAGKPDAKRPAGVHPRGTTEPGFFPAEAEGFAAACKELCKRSAVDALDECDDSADGRFLAGVLELFGKSYDDAAEAFGEALAQERKLGSTTTRLGVQLVAGVHFGNGLSVQFGPNAAGAKLGQVIALFMDGDIEGASAAADELVEFEPEDLAVKLLRAEIAMAEGTKAAHQLVNRMTTDIEGNGALERALLVHKARSLAALGLASAARDALSVAAENGKGHDKALNAVVLYEGAVAAEAQGDEAAARRDFERLYTIDPGYADVAERLGL
ncbi:Chromosome-partitioning ATPase Soj [Planctomycetes bacterium Poly30]|uniref:Chromosome-partitioning ATPase Soj n=1 Tax=Saltatorellus ferox TaxID=2528018 RepID=A0A518EKJ8_9BACT|nr:Chromosome-partitioning ATPase Soj [Planctomycetes bacterium Poly30]